MARVIFAFAIAAAFVPGWPQIASGGTIAGVAGIAADTGAAGTAGCGGGLGEAAARCSAGRADPVPALRHAPGALRGTGAVPLSARALDAVGYGIEAGIPARATLSNALSARSPSQAPSARAQDVLLAVAWPVILGGLAVLGAFGVRPRA